MVACDHGPSGESAEPEVYCLVRCSFGLGVSAMVRLWFKVKGPIPGIPGTDSGLDQELCLLLGETPNIALRTALHVPEGAIYGIIGNALLDGLLEDLTPDRMPAAVAEALQAAAASGEARPGPPPRHLPASDRQPLRFRRWRRARSHLRALPE